MAKKKRILYNTCRKKDENVHGDMQEAPEAEIPGLLYSVLGRG